MRVLSLFALFQVCQGFLTAPQGLNKVNLNVGGALSRAVPVKAPLEIGRSLTTSLPPLMSSAVAGEDRVARHGRTLSSLRNFVARLRCHLDFTLKIVVLFRETFSPPLLQFRKWKTFISITFNWQPIDGGSNEKKGMLNKLKSVMPPKNERKKLFPLGMIFFCILFNYTILRDTKGKS